MKVFLLNSDSYHAPLHGGNWREKCTQCVNCANDLVCLLNRILSSNVKLSINYSKLALYKKGPSFSTVEAVSLVSLSCCARSRVAAGQILHPEAAFWALWLQRRKWNEIAKVHTAGEVACSCIKTWFTVKNASVYPQEQHATIGCESSN